MWGFLLDLKFRGLGVEGGLYVSFSLTGSALNVVVGFPAPAGPKFGSQ